LVVFLVFVGFIAFFIWECKSLGLDISGVISQSLDIGNEEKLSAVYTRFSPPIC